MQVSPQSVTQTVVTNCSFVCSLAVSAGYEAKFKRALIGSIVYPQNRSVSRPVRCRLSLVRARL